jgi:hypothetical protein
MLLQKEALLTTVFFVDSCAYGASIPLPFMVVVPDRRSLRLARNTRLECAIVVKQEPAALQGVRHAVRVPGVLSVWNVYADRESRDRMSTTILAPTPFIAANFIILGRITQRLGPQYCRLTFKHCEWFCLKGRVSVCAERIQRTQTRSCFFHA